MGEGAAPLAFEEMCSVSWVVWARLVQTGNQCSSELGTSKDILWQPFTATGSAASNPTHVDGPGEESWMFSWGRVMLAAVLDTRKGMGNE